MDVGPRARALFGISGPGDLDLTAGIQVGAPNPRASLFAGASSRDEVCDGANVGIKAEASIVGDVTGVLEFGAINLDIPIATLFEVPLAAVCITPGGDAPLGDDGQPVPSAEPDAPAETSEAATPVSRSRENCLPATLS